VPLILVYLSNHFGAIQSWIACRSPKSRKHSLRPAIFGVQGHSRSSMLTFLRSSTPVRVTIAAYLCLSATFFTYRRAYIGIITLFKRGCPSFALSFEGIPFTQQHEILSRNTKNNSLSYGKNPKSLSNLVLDWYHYQVVTDRRTDRISVANTRYNYASSRA